MILLVESLIAFLLISLLNNVLSILKFKCKNGCNEIINYDNLEKHYEEDCDKIDFKTKYKELLIKYNALKNVNNNMNYNNMNNNMMMNNNNIIRANNNMINYNMMRNDNNSCHSNLNYYIQDKKNGSFSYGKLNYAY